MKKEKLLFKTEKTNSYEFFKNIYHDTNDIKKILYLMEFIILFISLIIAYLSKSSLTSLLILFLILSLINTIYIVSNKEKFIQNSYKKIQKYDGHKTTYNFYENYLEAIGDFRELKILYEEIDKIIEADNYIYIYNGGNIIATIEKNDKKLIEFLKSIENVKYIDNKNKKLDKKEKIIKTSKILSIINIISIIIFLSFPEINNELSYSSLSVYASLAILLFFIIPIYTFIFSIVNYKTYEKVIINLLLSILIIFCSVWEVSTIVIDSKLTKSYSKNISNYNEILGINLPDDVILYDNYIYNINNKDIKNNKTLQINFKINDAKKIEKEMDNNLNYMKANDVNSSLAMLVPKFDRSLNNYILIYNKTTDEYNKIPTETGDYEFIVFIYNIDNDKMYLYEYNYSYKK